MQDVQKMEITYVADIGRELLYIFLISINNKVNLIFCVCMNIFISKTKNTRVVKFGDNIF